MVAIDIGAREVRWQSPDRDAVLFHEGLKFFDGDAWRLWRRKTRRFASQWRSSAFLGRFRNDPHVDRRVVWQIERRFGVNGAVAVGGFKFEAHDSNSTAAAGGAQFGREVTDRGLSGGEG